MRRLLLLLGLCCLPGFAAATPIPTIYADLAKPAFTVAPAVTGETENFEVGETLTCSAGTVANGVLKHSYQWYDQNGIIVGATSSTYDSSSQTAGDEIYCHRGALNAAGWTYTDTAAVTLTGAGNATLVSATINSAGDTLTVVLSGNDTITDETGWSLSFDNYAERVLNYVSGSGSDTFIFSIAANPTYTSEDTDNDAAPVGTTATLNYDSDTGNVGTLADVGGYSITNNSTAHPDPDLPEQMDASLPGNWNDPADYTPSDNAALQALVTGGGLAGKIVELTAGTDYGYIDWSNLAGGASTSAPTIFRTSEWDNVDWPAYGERLPDTINGNPCTDYMPTISRTITVGTQGLATIPDVDNVRFVGINWESRGTFTGVYSSAFYVYSACENLIFDQCRFWWQDELAPVQGFDVDNAGLHKFAVIYSRFENYDGQTQDSSPIWLYDGKVFCIRGNYIECINNGCFTADNGPRVVEDVTFIDNHVTRPADWSTGHGVQKAGAFESKGCKRLWITRNRIENTFSNSWPAIIIKSEHASNRSVQVTIDWNEISSQGTGKGIVHHVNGSVNKGGPNTDVRIANNSIYDNYYRAIELDGGSNYYRIKVIHNTLPNDSLAEYSHFYYDGSSAGRYLVCRDNIVRGYGAAIGGSFQGAGATGFNASFSSFYSGTYNVFFDASAGNHDSSTSPSPLGTLANNKFPAFAAVGFIDAANDDYRLTPGSAYSSTGTFPSSDGLDRGADITTLNTIMGTVEE